MTLPGFAGPPGAAPPPPQASPTPLLGIAAVPSVGMTLAGSVLLIVDVVKHRPAPETRVWVEAPP